MQIDVGATLPLEAIAADAGAVDAEGRFPREAIDQLTRAGLLGLGLPESLGGAGGGPVEFVGVVEQVAGACASTGMVYVMHVVGAQTVLAGVGNQGAAGPKQEALEAMAAGRHLTTLAYSDRGSRGHFWAQVSHAVEDGEGLVVDADKTWATSAGHANSYVLAVGAPNTDDPLSTELYLVPSDQEGVAIPAHFDGLGMRGNASAPLRVRGLRLSAQQRLGDERSGFALMMTATLPWFTLGSAACSVGIAAAALDAAIAHATRARLDHEEASLAQVPGVRARLAYARVRLRESRALLREVAAAVASDDPSAQEGVLAVKASAAEMAIEVTDLAMRVGGGAAYSKHGPLERHLRDARAAAVMAPTTELLHDFLGKAITGQELFLMAGYQLGAVVYHPKVEQIWHEFSGWFAEQGLDLHARYYDRYEDQIEDLLDGALDTAWNTNLAHVRVLQRTDGEAKALAMRDTDRGWRSHLVARSDSDVRELRDLLGRPVGFGDADSPQAHIMPVHALRAEGVDPDRDFRAHRLDRDLGKHGDTGGAELAQLARVRAGELDACVVSSVTLDAVGRLGDAAGLTTVWTSPPFHHCCFSVLDDSGEAHQEFRRLLFGMDASDPRLCEPMELEYVNRWVPFDRAGYAELEAAVAAGPITVGEGTPA